MSKHTKGPYKAHVTRPSWYGMEAKFFEVTDANGVVLAFIKEWSDAAQESQANTKLFAAAPELLEALRQITREYRRIRSADMPHEETENIVCVEAALKAMAKATA